LGLGCNDVLMRRILRLLLALTPFSLTLALLLWTLTHNPYAAPFVDRSRVGAERALALALSRHATPAWYDIEMRTALDADDFDRVTTVSLIGEAQGFTPDADTQIRIAALEARVTGPWATLRGCGICIADVADCPSLALLASCGIPVELTPVGDLNALRRATLAAWANTDVDEVEVTLALVGLGATGAVLVSGGTSYSVKAGATVLRVARRLGTVTPRFGNEMRRLSDVGLQPRQLWAFQRGQVPLDAVIDTGRLAGIMDVSADLSRVAARTSVADAAVLMRHVDNADDAARLARVADMAGPRTRATFEVLGKSQVFRALIRLSDLAISAAALAYLLALQIALLVAERLGRITLRGLRRAIPA
jgi:hypothetical protein